MSLILHNIAKHIDLTNEEEELFCQWLKWSITKLKLLYYSQDRFYSYFVNSGILRSFNINDNIEHTLTFACAGWWIGDMYSLISQRQPVYRSIRRCWSSIVKENHDILYTRFLN
jgi:hypothetical protein